MEDTLLGQIMEIQEEDTTLDLTMGMTMAMAAGIQDLILDTTLVPIPEIIMEEGILDLMVAIILVQTMAMEEGILVRILAMGVVTTLEMAGIQGQIMKIEDGTLDGEAECWEVVITYFLPVSVKARSERSIVLPIVSC